MVSLACAEPDMGMRWFLSEFVVVCISIELTKKPSFRWSCACYFTNKLPVLLCCAPHVANSSRGKIIGTKVFIPVYTTLFRIGLE